MNFRTLYILLCTMPLLAQDVQFQGQASLWSVINSSESVQAGARYIPQLFAGKGLTDDWRLDVELSCQAVHYRNYINEDLEGDSTRISAYRAWIRLTSHQFEIRAGLQKINFGSARLFRPLMWFDRLDPRDPLQLTDGVYALLMKYTLLDNANFWFWSLYGNHDTRGWEFLPTRKRFPEWGGRIQWPAGPGEIAVTGHFRHVDTETISALAALTGETGFAVPGAAASETRLALDGRWDIKAGVWFEIAAFRQNWASTFQNQILGTIGLDYTFGIGNGLFSQVEHFTWQSGWNSLHALVNFSAVSLNYPVNLFDHLSFIGYYDWDREYWYRLADWQHTTDHFELHLITFWNPARATLFQFQNSASLFSGKGIQCMIVYNH